MKPEVLAIIKTEIEKIETETKFGQVLITIENGKVIFIKPTPCIKVA